MRWELWPFDLPALAHWEQKCDWSKQTPKWHMEGNRRDKTRETSSALRALTRPLLFHLKSCFCLSTKLGLKIKLNKFLMYETLGIWSKEWSVNLWSSKFEELVLGCFETNPGGSRLSGTRPPISITSRCVSISDTGNWTQKIILDICFIWI